MRRPPKYSITEIATKVYKQVLLAMFKLVVFGLALAGWFIGLLKKRTR